MRRILYTLVTTSVLFLSACSAEHSAKNQPTVPDAAPSTSVPEPDRADAAVVLFLGDSITAGYGLADPAFAFPAILQRRADSLGIPVRMVNAGLSGETSAGGLRRIDWLVEDRVDVLVLELGGNDGLRGVDLRSTRQNLLGIVERTRAAWPDAHVIVAGMMIPPNLGADYTEAFRAMYPDVARETGADLIPFILDGVAGVDGMMQADGIHPTAAGNRVMADLVWPYVLEALDVPALP